MDSQAAVQAADTSELPSVVVLSTGGTIAGRGGSSTSLSEYKAGQIKGSELVEAVPEIKQYASVRTEQIVNLGSTNLTTAVWLILPSVPARRGAGTHRGCAGRRGRRRGAHS